MAKPIYRSRPSPRVLLLDRNGTDITPRGEVGVDYNNKNCIEYTKYAFKGICDGYSVEVPQHSNFIPGTIIVVDVINSSPTAPTTPVAQTFTVGTNFTWPIKFILWAAMRINLAPGILNITYTATTPPTSVNSGGIIYISTSTYMTATGP